jgi:hypothetical protein
MAKARGYEQEFGQSHVDGGEFSRPSYRALAVHCASFSSCYSLLPTSLIAIKTDSGPDGRAVHAMHLGVRLRSSTLAF